MIKRTWLIGLVSVVIVLILGVVFLFSDVAQARPPAQEPSAGITIPYPGRLTDDAGHAIDGVCDFTFAMYDAASEGNLLWSELQQGLSVQGGSFITALGSVEPIPAALMEEGERWLEVSVRGPNEAGFTALSPRQQLKADAVPDASINAGAPCPHDHYGDSWTGTGTGLSVTLEGGGSSASLISIFSAVYGSHSVFSGVMGVGTGGSATGVWGQAVDGYGVFGTSTNGSGGFFTSDQDNFDIGLGGARGRINAAENVDSQLFLSANGDIILKLDNDGGGNHVLRVQNSGGGDVFTVDEAGNVRHAGSISPMTSAAQIEEFGTAVLVDGEAYVAFDPTFSVETDYHVFLTPLSDEPVLLYVTAKTAEGFTVKGVTLDGRPADCSFDYRVVAEQLSFEEVAP